MAARVLMLGACLHSGLRGAIKSISATHWITSCRSSLDQLLVLPQGVEPELYAPSGAAGRDAARAWRRVSAATIGAAERDPSRPHTWFSNLFNGGASGGSADNLHRDSRATTASASALDHPPQVHAAASWDSLPSCINFKRLHMLPFAASLGSTSLQI